MLPPQNICPECLVDFYLFPHEMNCTIGMRDIDRLLKADYERRHPPGVCRICGKKLTTIGVDRKVICPVHSTRGVPV